MQNEPVLLLSSAELPVLFLCSCYCSICIARQSQCQTLLRSMGTFQFQ